MTEATIKNLKEVSSYIRTLPEDTFGVAKKEIARTLFEVDAKIKTKTTLNRRSGQLFKSIQTDVSGSNLDNLHASVFTDSIYAPPHETGATIKAKNAYLGVPGGPFLNIPGKANKTAAGVMRKTAKQVFDDGGFVMGRTVMRGGDDEARRYDVMFFLKKQVKIPKRLGMIETTEGEVPTILSRIAAAVGQN